MDELLSETVSLSESEIITANPPEPKSIGSGIVKSVLGKGGASVVYEIWNPKLEINRAVKLWRPVQSEKTIQRFENEIKITAKLHHPNIVDIYTVGEWNGLPYIEMEKIQGINLKELIKSQGAVPELVVAAIAVCICRALVYAHNHEYVLSGKKCKGVIHCDIKPANIMISETGIVKLMDFGIAHPSGGKKAAEKSSITGSLQYMSPEQLESRPIDSRSDLYSLGVLLYELYSGTKAFPAGSIKELIQKRKINDFSPLGSFCRGLSARSRVIVDKLMKIDPAQRFQSADELIEEIQKDYQQITLEPPESIISRFLSGEKLKINKKKIGLPKLFHLSLFFFVLSFSGFIVYLWSNKKQEPARVFRMDPLSADSLKKTEPPTTEPSSGNAKGLKKTTSTAVKPHSSSNRTAPVQNKRPPIRSSSSSRSKSAQQPTVKKVESVLKPTGKTNEEISDATILDEIKRLFSEGQTNQAERMLQEFPLNDGEYHLIFAEVYLKKQQFKNAIQEAERASRVASARISPSELRDKVLFFKARVLSAEYENFPDKQSGQKAMEGWYEVKYAHRSNISHPHYIKADAEIRRISASIQ